MRNDPHIQHRIKQKRLEREIAGAGYGQAAAMFRQLAGRVFCPRCGAEADQPCISTSKAHTGDELPGFHQERVNEARQKFGRKK